jgi:nucleotide-binding universal stress UspA family protein
MASTAMLRGTELKRIVFGTDFSAVADRAATYARGLALSFGASVDVVHVFDADVYLDDAEPRLRTLDDRLEARSEKLEELAKRFVATGVQTKTELPMVRPGWSGLLKAAEAEEADLIVVATRSKAQLKRVFVGSTVNELIRNASQPVLTVGPCVESAPTGPLEFKRIVYATAFLPEAEKAAQAALMFAVRGRATLYVCHVIDSRAEAQETPEEGDARERRARKTLELRIAASPLAKFGCEMEIRDGSPAKAILTLAEKVNADLIVMGPRKPSFWLTHVKRGVTLEVLAKAKCPVLTVHAIQGIGDGV